MSFCLFWSIETDFRSIENCKWVFLKVRSWHVQSIFFKKFSKLSSLSPTQQGSTAIFCRFTSKFLQGFSLYKPVCPLYPFFFTYFLFYMHFFHALEGYFQTMHKLGFFMIQAEFCEIDQWVLLIYCYIHDLCWLIWSIWGIGMFSKFYGLC